jgi:hypothetical protein
MQQRAAVALPGPGIGRLFHLPLGVNPPRFAGSIAEKNRRPHLARFLVDIGCFQDLLQAGKLRAIDEGGR